MKTKLLLSLVMLTIQFTYSQIVPELQWVKTYDGVGHKNDFLNKVCVDKSKNIYMAGQSEELNGALAFFLIKYNETGDSLFTERYVSAPTSWNEVNSMAVDADQNIYAIGTASFGQSFLRGIFFKFDINGNVVWQKTYGLSNKQAVAVDYQNNPIIGINVGEPAGAAEIIKYSPAGDSLWGDVFYYESSSLTVNNFLIDSSGFMYVVLKDSYEYGSDVPGERIRLMKLNQDGIVQWGKTINKAAPLKLIHDKESNLILATERSIIKLSANGDSIWENSSFVINTDVAVDSKNNIIISGFGGGIGGMDYVTRKISSGGTELWDQEFNSQENLRDFASCVTVDNKDNIYISGGSNEMVSQGVSYTLRYSESGQLTWQQRFKATHSIYNDASTIFLDDSNNVFVAGDYTDSTNGSNYFLFKIKQNDKTGVDADLKNFPYVFELRQNYPNPFNPTTTINYSLAKAGNVRLTVYNILGCKAATVVDGYKSAGNYSVQFNGSNLASGIYLYRLESGNFSEARKLILMK